MSHTSNFKKRCVVCKQVKKYFVLTPPFDDEMGKRYDEATRGGVICKRCWRYYFLTGRLEFPVPKNIRIAKHGLWFSIMLDQFYKENPTLVGKPITLEVVKLARQWAELYNMRKRIPGNRQDGVSFDVFSTHPEHAGLSCGTGR